MIFRERIAFKAPQVSEGKENMDLREITKEKDMNYYMVWQSSYTPSVQGNKFQQKFSLVYIDNFQLPEINRPNGYVHCIKQPPG